jgi:hypothetical protein
MIARTVESVNEHGHKLPAAIHDIKLYGIA